MHLYLSELLLFSIIFRHAVVAFLFLGIVAVHSAGAASFVAIGVDCEISKVYYDRGGEMVPVVIKNNRYSAPYEFTSDFNTLSFYERDDNTDNGEVSWVLTSSVEVEKQADFHVLLFHRLSPLSKRYQIAIYSDYFTESKAARVVFLNVSENPVVIAFNEQRIPLDRGALSEVLVEENETETNANIQEVRLAFYLEPEWEIFYSTRWALSGNSVRLVFIRLNDKKEMEVDYINLGISALRQSIER